MAGKGDQTVTVELLGKTVEKAVNDAVAANFSSLSSGVLAEMQRIVDKVSILEKRQDSLEERVNNLDGQVWNEVQALREEIKEERRKIIRLPNIVLMGVPESQEGLEKAKQILAIIAPTFTAPLLDKRIGDANGKKPRPLRVSLATANDKQAALRNCKKLKGLKQFESVSVRKDLTKAEQKQWREKFSGDKRVTRREKRKQDGMDDSDDRRNLKEVRMDEGPS